MRIARLALAAALIASPVTAFAQAPPVNTASGPISAERLSADYTLREWHAAG